MKAAEAEKADWLAKQNQAEAEKGKTGRRVGSIWKRRIPKS